MKHITFILAACCLMMTACAQKNNRNSNIQNDNTQNNNDMKKTLIVYFSATGNTKAAAEKLAREFNADLYEITPETPYTAADLDWRDKSSRSTLEMKDKSSRPAIKGVCGNIAQYDTVWIGFPVWWYTHYCQHLHRGARPQRKGAQCVCHQRRQRCGRLRLRPEKGLPAVHLGRKQADELIAGNISLKKFRYEKKEIETRNDAFHKTNG